MKGMVLGITGTNGAGKSVVVEHLIAHYGATVVFSVGTLLQEMVSGVRPSDHREVVKLVDSLRHEQEHLAHTLSEMEEGIGTKLAVIESLKCSGEIDYLRQRFGNQFVLIGIDAPPEVRYYRVLRRGSDEKKDCCSFEEFQRQEALETRNVELWEQNLLVCMTYVKPEFFIWNPGARTLLHERVHEIMWQVGIKAHC